MPINQSRELTIRDCLLPEINRKHDPVTRGGTPNVSGEQETFLMGTQNLVRIHSEFSIFS